MNGRESGSAEARWIERAAHDLAVEAERFTGVADQGASDADQTASDADQTAAERDEADAISDQRVADIDQARADLDLPAGSAGAIQAKEDSRRLREITRASRLVTHGTRAETARVRLGAAAEVADVERRFELIDHSLHAAVGAGISVGIAALAADETLDEVLARADSALLDAKRRRGA